MITDERSLCIVVHDVAPATWDGCQWLLDEVAAVGGFAVTLLAVPRYHGQPRNAGFERWLRARVQRGDEVALHGFNHLDESIPHAGLDRLRRRIYTRGEGEFAALTFDEATMRLRWGLSWLNDLGIQPAGFVAPAWLLSREAWSAVLAGPFRYTCTLRRVYLLNDPRGAALPALDCLSQVYSSSTWARQRISVLWNETLARVQRHASVVRLELHPGDEAPVITRSWQHLLRSQVATRRVMTLQQLAEALRTVPAPKSR